MKIRLSFVLCAVMLVLTFTGCEFPWAAEPTDPTHAARPSALEFVDGKEAESGKPQLSQMEVSEALAALEPYGFSLDDCTDEERAEWENKRLMGLISVYEGDMRAYAAVSGRPYGQLHFDLEDAIEEYYEWSWFYE